MFVISLHKILVNFEGEAREAIKAAFEKYGEPPNAVLVRPGTTILAYISVGLGSPSTVRNIPVTVREDPIIAKDEFGLDNSHGTLE